MQKVTKRNIVLAIIFLLILVVVALLIGNFTYSFLGADISDDVKTQGETTASGDTIIFSKGNDLSLHATTDNFNATSGNLTDTTNPSVRLIASNKTNEATATYYAGVRISTNTYTYSSGTTAEVILTVRDENGELVTTSSDGNLTYVTVSDKDGSSISGFDITGKTGVFNIAANYPISTTSSSTGTTHTWTFTITFVNYTFDQSINENSSLDIEVILQKNEIEFPTLADVCTNNEKIADCIQMYYEKYGEGIGGLYYHDGQGNYTNADQEAEDNSYRYSGANPYNYVCFGTNEIPCPSNNLYRIIGVFDGQIKLIKNTSIGGMLWDTNNVNTWSSSSLNAYLNETYLNSLGTYQNMIYNYNWQVGGMNWSTTKTTKEYYDVEVSDSIGITYSAKIGLMYVSDYGFAALPNYWNKPLYNYQSSKASNWLNGNITEWTISPNNDFTYHAFTVNSDGYIYGYRDAFTSLEVRPTFFLNSDIIFVNGTGSFENPIYVLNT